MNNWNLLLFTLMVAGIVAVLVVIFTEKKKKPKSVWVAVGDDSTSNKKGNIMFSENGKKWSESSDKGACFFEYGYAVGYGLDYFNYNPIFVAVGAGSSISNSILLSYDGKTWRTTNSVNVDQPDDFTGYGVAYGEKMPLTDGSGRVGLWVAVGGNVDQKSNSVTNIITSQDGINWYGEGSCFKITASGVAYGLSSNQQPLFVVVGDNNSDDTDPNTAGEAAGNIIYSSNGQDWNESDDMGASFKSAGAGVAYGLSSDKKTGLWVAVGDNFSYGVGGGLCAGNILYSLDGKTWVQSVGTGASFERAGLGVAYGLSSDKKTGIWVAVGDNNTIHNDTPGSGTCAGNILYSTDGQNWKQSNDQGASFRLRGNAVAYGLDDNNNPLWVAVGNNDTTIGTSAGNVLFSTDGQTWQTSRPDGATFNNEGSGVAHGLFF